jgi:hypothetical protein
MMGAARRAFQKTAFFLGIEVATVSEPCLEIVALITSERKLDHGFAPVEPFSLHQRD